MGVLFSCTEDELIDKTSTESGYPVSLTISFDPQELTVETRAGENQDSYADLVFDLTVFAFDENGERINTQSFTFVGGKRKEGTLTNFSTQSGINYIYAVANLSSSYYTDLKNELLQITDKDQFLSKVATLSQKSIDLVDGRFLMSGCYGTEGTGYVNIAKDATTLPDKIYLERMLASVTFKINKASGITFTPKSWKVMNVPESAYLFETATDCESQVFNSPESSFAIDQSTMTFYMMENRKRTTGVSDFKDRQSACPTEATYVVLTGEYQGPADRYEGFDPNKNPTESQVSATVTYYIPLGYSKTQSGTADLNDYTTERNTQYTYNVTVNGVNDIVVEVVKNTPTSVADGDVVYTDGGTMYLLDAHYEARVLTFEWDKISSDQITYKVKTPFTEGYQTGADDNWVKFKINKINRSSYATSCENYPGDSSSDLLTIEQLMDKIRQAKETEDNDGLFKNGKLVVTAFVDEYYYNDRNWWLFANKENREMQILCTSKSANGSTLTDATYVLSQRSIQTYYVTDGTATYAVGVEWTNETNKFEKSKVQGAGSYGSYSYGITSNYGTTQDGRVNMIKELQGSYSSQLPYWSNVPYLSDDLTTVNTAYNACMSRNRNTGSVSSRVTPAEVKWFLPSITQYQDLVMGQDGYDPAAILFPANTKDALHFYANNRNASDSRNVLWAEEGSSTSDYNEYSQSYNHSIRCMRYLGQVEKPTDDELKWWKQETRDGLIKVSMTHLNTNSIRSSYTTGELVMHTEVEENNKPYEAFWVYGEDMRISRTWAEVNGSYGNYTNSSVCPEGWRIPNQRELTLLMRARNTTAGNYISRTRFTGTDGKGMGYDGKQRFGFVFSNGGMGVSAKTNDVRGDIRCVRDDH